MNNMLERIEAVTAEAFAMASEYNESEFLKTLLLLLSGSQAINPEKVCFMVEKFNYYMEHVAHFADEPEPGSEYGTQY